MGFYEKAADILGRLERREGSIKNMTIGNRYLQAEDKRKMYALLCETLKYSSALITVIERSSLLNAEHMDRRLALVLSHDLLFARGGLQRRGADRTLNQTILKHKGRLSAELERLKIELGAESNKDLVPVHLRDNVSTFRYVRVNLLVSSVDEVVEAFQNERYRLVDVGEVGRDSLHSVLAPKVRKFARDPDLFDLLVFPPGTDLHAHPLYVNGTIILQDKASCMPAHVVQPHRGSGALDACAAPGNKTSHMVSLMHNEGRVFAFDMDQHRLNTLVKLTSNAKCKIIAAQCMSFLDVNPLDPQYADVEYALLDPSCSGSGIVSRLDALVDSYISSVNGGTGKSEGGSEGSRLSNLADFQLSIVLHAMKFPSVKRISYSTCSIHKEENEDVVSRVLGSQSEFGLAPADQVIPSWPRRGLENAGLTSEQAACVVRTLPEDGTNGFFVAGFVRERPADIAAIKRDFEARPHATAENNEFGADKPCSVKKGPSEGAAAASEHPTPGRRKAGRQAKRKAGGGKQKGASAVADDGSAEPPKRARASSAKPSSGAARSTAGKGKRRPKSRKRTSVVAGAR
ncbi:S-adenosyl-L-methionine-dependent methyltransferase [Martensiomyces pterosporus]|nr:S-adenosyl-L-methionine-dependent methyltransferase [Martensiomyces pterosporus]